MTDQHAETQEQEQSVLHDPIHEEITVKCIEITEQFHSGLLNKIRAILELQQAIPLDDDNIFRKTLGVYVRVLNNYEQIRERAAPPKGLVDQATGRDEGGDLEDEEEDTPRDSVHLSLKA